MTQTLTIEQIGARAKGVTAFLSGASSLQKDAVLAAIAKTLRENTALIVAQNAVDLENGRKAGLTNALLDRLALTPERIAAIARSVEKVAALPDPVGVTLSGTIRPNGLQILKTTVPMGVLGMIYEARPNVTVDAAVLSLKSSNACILRGGKEAIISNVCLCSLMRQALVSCGFPADAVQLVENTDRQSAAEMMRLNRYIDVLIPRGGAGLIRSVVENATVPVIETGTGNCHVYVEQSADLEMGANIIFNAKTSRPSVCNAAETLLVDQAVAEAFLPIAWEKLKTKGVQLRGCPRTRQILGEQVVPATEEDYDTEFLDYILAVRVVSGLDEAVEHIAKHSSRHSEAIVTRDYGAARAFTARVDAAAVYVNASTRFTDGEEFGLGAEMGISTQKLHARGPFGLQELTTTKYVVYGSGQVR